MRAFGSSQPHDFGLQFGHTVYWSGKEGPIARNWFAVPNCPVVWSEWSSGRLKAAIAGIGAIIWALAAITWPFVTGPLARTSDAYRSRRPGRELALSPLKSQATS